MKDKSIIEYNAVRIKMLFRENLKKEELPAPSFSIHKIRELSRLCGSAQQCSGGKTPGRKPSLESLPGSLSGAGTLNHSSICLRAKLFPKTPALSLICKLPKPGEGKNIFYCRGRKPPGWSCFSLPWCRGLQTPVGAGGCDPGGSRM